MKCIAIGCTSGYKSNPEKVHFFRVPKNNDKAKEWQKASRRSDLILNSSHCFCEKHFAENDIAWKKLLYNKDGEIIQEIPLKRPYVKEGMVPSLFPWTEFADKNSIIENTDENSIIKNIENIESASLKKSNNTEEEKRSAILTFNELKCNDKLYVPIGWTRNILPLENTYVIIFSKMMCKTTETGTQLICMKEIWITEDMKMQVKALGKPITLNTFGVSEEFLSSLNTLEDLIKIVETFNICEAFKNNYETEYTSTALKESNNILRHKKCPIVLENSTQCNFCKNLSYTLDRKKMRINDKGSEVKRIRVDLSPTKKHVIDKMREQKHNLLKCKKRQICTIKKLQKEIENIQNNLNTKNEQMLEGAMAGKNIPIYQQEALKEILSSSSRKNAKGS